MGRKFDKPKWLCVSAHMCHLAKLKDLLYIQACKEKCIWRLLIYFLYVYFRIYPGQLPDNSVLFCCFFSKTFYTFGVDNYCAAHLNVYNSHSVRLYLSQSSPKRQAAAGGIVSIGDRYAGSFYAWCSEPKEKLWFFSCSTLGRKAKPGQESTGVKGMPLHDLWATWKHFPALKTSYQSICGSDFGTELQHFLSPFLIYLLQKQAYRPHSMSLNTDYTFLQLSCHMRSHSRMGW